MGRLADDLRGGAEQSLKTPIRRIGVFMLVRAHLKFRPRKSAVCSPAIPVFWGKVRRRNMVVLGDNSNCLIVERAIWQHEDERHG